MFSSSIQPGIVSLFSSTGSDPLGLFERKVDSSLPADSFICLLQDSSSSPHPLSPAVLVSSLTLPTNQSQGDEDQIRPRLGYTLNQTVLHIQSPTLRTTYIRCPPIGQVPSRLGIQHPWIHMQVRHLGRDWSFEIGIVDKSGREGIVRCSTFQVPSFHPLILTCNIHRYRTKILQRDGFNLFNTALNYA